MATEQCPVCGYGTKNHSPLGHFPGGNVPAKYLARICCNVCRKATATVIIKDCGCKTYPACKTCACLMMSARTAVIVSK